MMERKQVPLTHSVYHQTTKLRGWNCKTAALRCHDAKIAARLIRRFGPTWTSQEHASIARYHTHRAEKLLAVYKRVLERAALHSLGRPWQFTDYKVSGVGRDEFSEAHKRVLRHCIHRSYEHEDMAEAHAVLARRN
jgi:hypothetical protein